MKFDFVSVLMMGVPGLVIAWVPMLWGAIVGKWKQVGNPLKFTFLTCCITHGVTTLGGAVLGIPLYFLFDSVTWLYGIKGQLSSIALLLVTILSPYWLLRFFPERQQSREPEC